MNIFSNQERAKVARSFFNLSHEYKTTFDIGQLIPISVVECLPGEIHRLGVGAVLRMQPMLAPILHNIKIRYYSFFVPYRILDDNWEEFITRGEDGEAVVNLKIFNPEDFTASIADVTALGSLWDYFAYYPIAQTTAPHEDNCPIDYPRRAYVRIWNEFFRIPGIQDEKTEEVGVAGEVYMPLYRNWTRDYFTSALPFQQRGLPVSLPVFGSTNAEFNLQSQRTDYSIYPNSYFHMLGKLSDGTQILDNIAIAHGDGNQNLNTAGQFKGENPASQIIDSLNNDLTNSNEISGASLSSVDIADLRLAWQTQVWMERNARGGARYVEQLQIRWGTSPRDERLQRPEYIGGYTSDFLISEVLQTSATDNEPTVQGNMSGHGISVVADNIGSYRVQEHGIIMTLVCVDPTPAYQQGIERSWLRRNTLDFPTPEFVHLSEQAILNNELYNQTTADDPTGSIGQTPFGYTGIYNEMRYISNKVTNEMRDTFDYWHLARKFSALPELNSDFVSIENDLTELKRIYAVTTVPGIIGSFGIRLKSIRPLPFIASPSSLGAK